MKNFSYLNLCEDKNPLLDRLIFEDQKIYMNWLNLMAQLYLKIYENEKDRERVENPSVASLWMEILETLDGIGILHSKSNINSAYSLIRKLLEVISQLKFMINGDSENKSLAFEAFYVSRATQGKDHPQNIFLNFEKYREYKQVADQAFADKPKFLDWYEIYLSKSISVNKLIAENISTDNANKIYSCLSQENHGFRARKNLKLSGSINYVESQRYPAGIYYQSNLCNLLMNETYIAICIHYSIEKNCCVFNENQTILNQIKMLEEKFISNDKVFQNQN